MDANLEYTQWRVSCKQEFRFNCRTGVLPFPPCRFYICGNCFDFEQVARNNAGMLEEDQLTPNVRNTSMTCSFTSKDRPPRLSVEVPLARSLNDSIWTLVEGSHGQSEGSVLSRYCVGVFFLNFLHRYDVATLA